jgi:hypothetical protein
MKVVNWPWLLPPCFNVRQIQKCKGRSNYTNSIAVNVVLTGIYAEGSFRSTPEAHLKHTWNTTETFKLHKICSIFYSELNHRIWRIVVVRILIIIITIRGELGLNKPVSVSSKSLFIGLPTSPSIHWRFSIYLIRHTSVGTCHLSPVTCYLSPVTTPFRQATTYTRSAPIYRGKASVVFEGLFY